MRGRSPCCRGRALRSKWRAACPTAVAVACADPVLAEDVQREFRAAYFRLYASTDVTGVEIGGALKNVIAIAAGVVEGPRTGTERSCRAHHPGSGRDYAPGLRRWRAPRDARGAQRAWRPRADVYRIAEPKPACRRRAGARPADFRRGRRHEDGCRGRQNDGRRPGARKKARRRAADRHTNGGGAGRRPQRGRGRRGADAAPAEDRSRNSGNGFFRSHPARSLQNHTTDCPAVRRAGFANRDTGAEGTAGRRRYDRGARGTAHHGRCRRGRDRTNHHGSEEADRDRERACATRSRTRSARFLPPFPHRRPTARSLTLS